MRVGLRIGAVAGILVAFVLIMVGINVDQASVRSTEYYCDDYDYAAERCDGDYQEEESVRVDFGRTELDVAGEGGFEYDTNLLDEVDGIGRLRAMGPLYVTGAILTGVTALGLAAAILVRFPLNVIVSVLGIAAVGLVVTGMAVGLSGAADLSEFIEDAEDDDEYITDNSRLRWEAGPILVLIGSVLGVAGSVAGFVPARVNVRWAVDVTPADGGGRTAPPAGPVDFDGPASARAPATAAASRPPPAANSSTVSKAGVAPSKGAATKADKKLATAGAASSKQPTAPKGTKPAGKKR